MHNKHAFVVYAGQNESGRVYHALAHAKQVHARGDVSELYFAAEGTYWASVLGQESHPMHSLFHGLKESGVVKGACQNCAESFGHKEEAEENMALIMGPDCSLGQIDIIGLEDSGFRVWTF